MDQSFSPVDTFDLSRVARLVRPFETLETTAVPRPGGGWAIGYGHVRSARQGAQVTREEAEALLLYDLRHTAAAVRAAIYAPIHRNQLEALIAFAFHIGTERFLTSTTLHRFNAGDSLGAAQELERWCCADFGADVQVVDALVRRRAAEKAHFLTPPEGFPKASRARLRPQVEAVSTALSDETQAAPSAALAAADSVSARLRALVPDLPTDRTADPSPEVADPTELRPATFEPTPAPAVEPIDDSAPDAAEPRPTDPEPARIPELATAVGSAAVVLDAVATPETEIPPPPMPFEAATSPAPRPASPEVATPRHAIDNVWPSYPPAAVGSSDPFAQGPLDAAAIEAPPSDDLTLDRAAVASLFRAKPDPRVESAPPPKAGEPSSPRSSWPSLSWSKAPRSWLWAALIIGLGIFVWAIWSIFKTTPGPVNFLAGLLGIAVMAAPAYLLLGARDRSVP